MHSQGENWQQVWGPDSGGVTWLRELAQVAVTASWAGQPRSSCRPAVHRVGSWRRPGVCGSAGRGRVSTDAASSACPGVVPLPPNSLAWGCLGFPPSPGWGPTASSSLCGFLVLWEVTGGCSGLWGVSQGGAVGGGGVTGRVAMSQGLLCVIWRELFCFPVPVCLSSPAHICSAPPGWGDSALFPRA